MEIRYPTRQVAVASCRSVAGGLTLFLPTTETIETGTPVTAHVGFGDAAETFDVAGTVAWRRSEAQGAGLEPGLVLEVAPAERYQASRMLEFCTGRPVAAASSAGQRFPTQLAAVVRTRDERLQGCVRDVSATGLFVAGDGFGRIEPGDEVVILLRTGWLGFGARRLRARLVWHGMKYGIPGFGAQFVDDPARTGRILKRYLRAKKS